MDGLSLFQGRCDGLAHHGHRGFAGLGRLDACEGQESGSEGARGVDGAAVDGDQDAVGHEDGEADGDASLTAVQGRLWIAGRLVDDEDQQEGAHDLGDQSVPPIPLRTHAVRAQGFGHVQFRRKDRAQDGCADDGAHHLGGKVENALQQPTVAGKDQTQGHSAVEVTAAVVSDSVSQGCDGKAKDQGHHENPARNHGGRLSRGGIVVATAAARAT